MYRLYLVVVLLFLSACPSECPAPAIPHDFGDPYAELDCTWVDPKSSEDRPALWRCFEQLETGILSGFIFLELENSKSLYLCGTDLKLRSGVVVYDNLIGFLTEDRYNCLHLLEDENLGNSFDWTWESGENVLQFIWRPEDEPDKFLTLVVENGAYNEVVRSTVYYKMLLDD